MHMIIIIIIVIVIFLFLLLLTIINIISVHRLPDRVGTNSNGTEEPRIHTFSNRSF